jgi:hypothetical protein
MLATSGVDVDAEQAAEHGRRQLRCEVDQRGVACSAAEDADRREASLEPADGQRPSGCAPGEQPGMRVGAADDGAAVPIAVQLLHERPEWGGQVNGYVTEKELNPLRVGDDLVAGEKGDVGEGLAVEQHEQAVHAVRRGEVLVVQERFTVAHR